MLFLALVTAALASNQPISPSTRALEQQMLRQFKQGLQTVTQSDVDRPQDFPIKVTKGESIDKVRQALTDSFKQEIKAAEAQADPNAAIRQLYNEIQGDDHWPSAQEICLAAAQVLPRQQLSKDQVLAIIRQGVESYMAALTQEDVDTNARGFNPDLHVTNGTPVAEVRQRMRANLTKLLKLAESNNQLLESLYTEITGQPINVPEQNQPIVLAATSRLPLSTGGIPLPYSGPETADALYKYDVGRAEYGFKNTVKNGGFTQQDFEDMAKNSFFKDATKNVPADRLGDAEFQFSREYLRKARDNNDLNTLKMFSHEG
jgi:hypothetical protein